MHLNSSRGMVVIDALPLIHQPSMVVKASDGFFYRVESPRVIGGYLSSGRWSSGHRSPVAASSASFKAKGGPQYV